MTATATRRRTLIVPREHGAWGILLVPLATGAAVGVAGGGDDWRLVPLTIAALALFWLRTPLESSIGATPLRPRGESETRLVQRAVLGLASVAAAAAVWLFQSGRSAPLVWLGTAASAAFTAQAMVKRARHKMAAQMIGAAGLTAMAPAAYFVAAGHWGAAAWGLWAANLAFAVNQIHFVQLRIRAARASSRREKLMLGSGFLAGQVLLAAALAGACAAEWLGWRAALAFAPILARGLAWFAARPRPLAVHALGKSELAHACLFGALLAALW